MGKVYLKGILCAVIIALLGFTSAYYLTAKVSERLIDQEYIKLEHAAKQISTRFQDAINISTNDLQALQAFYSAKKQAPSQDEFNQYMAVLEIEQRHYIQALSWVPLVYDAQRDEFERFIRDQQSDFSIKSRNDNGVLGASKRKSYYTPVTYISPYNINKAAQGFDLSSSPSRHESLHTARDSGEMTATSKIRLVQETGESYGFLIIAPVYKTNANDKGPEERANLLLGYVTGVYRIDTLMARARVQADKVGLDLTLYDVEGAETSLLYGQKSADAAFSFDILIPDRFWQLNLSINTVLKEKLESPSIANWILAGGSLISLLLAISFYALQTSIIKSRHVSQLSLQLQLQNRELEATVSDRTKTLSTKNDLLNQHVERLESQKKTLSRLKQESDLAKLNAEKLAKDLAKSNQDLDEFAYVASHDLKAPLRGISQLSHWMEEDIEDGKFDEIPKILQMVTGRVKRLEALLNDLLEYSRVNRHKSTLTQLDSQKLIEDLFPLYAPVTGFKLILEGGLPVFDTQKAPFEQVIRNLLNNAFKHHDKSEGSIQVRCEDQGLFYKFMVKDDGPGIDSDHFDEIFKMFKTLKSRDEVEGSGMGLALIKKIVEHYGGQIYLESTLGEGTAFYFTWPKTILGFSD